MVQDRTYRAAPVRRERVLLVAKKDNCTRSLTVAALYDQLNAAPPKDLFFRDIRNTFFANEDPGSLAR